MKALILAAGFGTRLLPYTNHTPKPLFPISGNPLLNLIIENLKRSGCTGIVINTHHLHEKIEAFIASQNYGIPVITQYEPTILGTGGAIKNTADFFDASPFMVINSDILTDISLRDVYEFHLGHNQSATLVLHDHQAYNNVSVTNKGSIIGFHEQVAPSQDGIMKKLAFTGIQVLDADLIPLIQQQNYFSSIDLYQHMISKNQMPKALIVKDHFWTDIGTPESYLDTEYRFSAPQAFQKAFSISSTGMISKEKLKGDGSDRQWYRLSAENRTLILVRHGIREQIDTCEVDSFIQIGQHLQQKKIPVPAIYGYNAFSGLVFLEDLGDTHLEDVVKQLKHHKDRMAVYQEVIKLLIHMSQNGKIDFLPSMTYQTREYSKDLIIEKECRYFKDAFLKNYMKMNCPEKPLENDFSDLADSALQNGMRGFMHRDFQSRNIMVKENSFYLIDFQGGRIGPLQYDLASLLIDPYVALPFDEQMELIDFCAKTLEDIVSVPIETFRKSVFYCALTRNLQILGAFGYLSLVKGKKWFEQYIPCALQSLRYYLQKTDKNELPVLKTIAETLKNKRGST
ncbi:MAG: aminoglycoside phosphotransferase [Desulfobacterium sp.]|nr:aminoglycoside phosphotransferase [Desulfobacterium sp.]